MAMKVVEALRGIMDCFDSFFDPTAPEESDDARRRALAEIAHSKDYADAARGRAVITERLIDVIFPKTTEKKVASVVQMTDSLLGVLETNSAEVETVMRRLVLLHRLDRLVAEAGYRVNLRPAESAGELGGRDQVYKRAFEDWDVTLGYFPEHVRHHAIYGQNVAPPLIDKKLAVSARYHRTEHYMAPQLRAVEQPSLVGFLKDPQLNVLAEAYGLSYELPPIGVIRKATTHTAKGGYKVMVDTLEEELKRTPFSAEKLIGQLNAVTVFHEDPGLSLHVVVEFPKGHPDVGQNLILAFGADLFSLTKEKWDEFKRMPPLAIAALEPLKG